MNVCKQGYDLDLRKPLPLTDGSASVVYSEHFLEHLGADDARRFLAECRRVLRPGGLCHVVVPDAGRHVREYARRRLIALAERRFAYRPLETEDVAAAFAAATVDGFAEPREDPDLL